MARPRHRQPGATTARGYGAKHQKERATWQPIVDAGMAHCHAVRCLKADRWIKPGTAWDLGHNEDRTAWTGPEHASCNRTAGARNAAIATNTKRRGVRTSREW